MTISRDTIKQAISEAYDEHYKGEWIETIDENSIRNLVKKMYSSYYDFMHKVKHRECVSRDTKYDLLLEITGHMDSLAKKESERYIQEDMPIRTEEIAHQELKVH